MKPGQHKILLIEPPFYRLFKGTYSLDRFPLSLGYLAGTIKKETDWHVMAYNADFNPESERWKMNDITSTGFGNYLSNLKDLTGQIWGEVRRTILDYKPAVIGISAKSQTFASTCIVAKLAKEINKEAIVIVGGPHPSMVGKDILKCPDIDIGVKGEGERTIVELLNAIKTGKKFDNVKGILYRKNGEVIENAPREFIEDLDLLCFPHECSREVLKDYDRYPITAFRNIFATRGCPYNCFFCGSYKIWSRRVRFRSVGNVISEIKSLQRLGLKFIQFDDDTFGINKKYINDLCNTFTEYCPGLKWKCEIHVKLVNDKTILTMKKAGCYSIQLGVESGNNEMLKKIKKDITIEKAISACKIIKKYGIDLEAFFIVGFPEETEDTLNETIKAMKTIGCDILSYSIFTPYPGTEAFKFCKENGLIDDNYDVSLYSHQSPVNSFCSNIPQDRFRSLASKIEKMVDRKNSLNKIRRIFSFNTIARIQEIGTRRSLREGIKILTGK